MPSRWLCESRPLRDEPWPFLCAMVASLSSWRALSHEENTKPEGRGSPSFGFRNALWTLAILLAEPLFVFPALFGRHHGHGERRAAIDPLGWADELDLLGAHEEAIAEALEVQLQRLAPHHRAPARRD